MATDKTSDLDRLRQTLATIAPGTEVLLPVLERGGLRSAGSQYDERPGSCSTTRAPWWCSRYRSAVSSPPSAASAADLESDIVYAILMQNPTMADGTALFHADRGAVDVHRDVHADDLVHEDAHEIDVRHAA